MDRADTCRRAARDALADVDPPQLCDVIADVLDAASMVPGALALESAAAADPDADLEAIAHRAAGVQLVYEGLRLTRTLARDEPWAAGETGRADLEVLAADILVARGFYLLARTDAADKAVETVRNFGRNQTHPDVDDASLERDVLELATLTGATAVGSTPTPELTAAARDLAADADAGTGAGAGTGFPPAAECLPVLTGSEAGSSAGAETPSGDGLATDRATSATDP